MLAYLGSRARMVKEAGCFDLRVAGLSPRPGRYTVMSIVRRQKCIYSTLSVPFSFTYAVPIRDVIGHQSALTFMKRCEIKQKENNAILLHSCIHVCYNSI